MGPKELGKRTGWRSSQIEQTPPAPVGTEEQVGESIILFPPDKIKMEARKYQLLVKGIDRQQTDVTSGMMLRSMAKFMGRNSKTILRNATLI